MTKNEIEKQWVYLQKMVQHKSATFSALACGYNWDAASRKVAIDELSAAIDELAAFFKQNGEVLFFQEHQRYDKLVRDPSPLLMSYGLVLTREIED